MNGASASLTGVVRDLLFRNESSGWTVARIDVEGRAEPACVVGVAAGLAVGDLIEVRGVWHRHPQYGEQLEFAEVRYCDPTTEQGIVRYLSSGAIEGIGEGLARRIVDAFGTDTLRVIDEEPERLATVKGIGATRIGKIRATWEEHRAQRRALVFLQSHGLGAALAARVFASYGVHTVAEVRRNPYALIREVRGVGFATADRIAREIGLAADHPARIEAGARHVLDEAADDGHTYVPVAELCARAATLLGCPESAAKEGVERLEAAGELSRDGERAYLPGLFEAECESARHLARLLRAPFPRPAIEADTAASWVERAKGIELGDEQRVALRLALARKVCVITGGPGVGKTTLLDAFLRILDTRNVCVDLCAPTGRAARRMTEATGRKAKTIHRLLEFSPKAGVFTRNEEDPLDVDALVVDEASMIDIVLFRRLLAALPDSAQLVLVGDADQLPSVGPGQVLRDVIAAGAVPIAHLGQVYRQAEGSGIVAAAHRVLAGRLPPVPPPGAKAPSGPVGDFHFVEVDDPERAGDMILRLCRERIPQRFGLDPIRDVQVLSPIYRGEAGVDRLNERLREALNPASDPAWAAAPLRPGDKVMQLRNDYEKDVSNGDVGFIVTVDHPNRRVQVRFDDRTIEYAEKSLADLALAYACSIHKSQGSEYPAVVIALLPQHHVMLNRNLLYTAITRGKRLVVVVGARSALERAARLAPAAGRWSGLADRIATGVPADGPS